MKHFVTFTPTSSKHIQNPKIPNYMTDEAAMLLVVNGEVDKAAILYERYKKQLLNFFLRFGLDRDTSYDLTHQTFYRLLQYKHTFKEGYAFRTWIYRIARNLFHDLIKDKHFNTSQLLENIDIADVGNSDEESYILVQKAMQELPTEYKEVLQLSRYEDLKYNQIAEVLDISEALVKVRVHRAIKKLREIYFKMLV